MKKIIALLLSIFIVSALFAGCSSNQKPAGTSSQAPAASSSSTGAVLELKLGHVQSATDLWETAAQKFAAEVAKNSNGKIVVKTFPSSTLGADRDMAEGMQMGTVDFALIAGVLSNFEKSVGLLEIPYLFSSQEQFNKAINGASGKQIKDNLLKSSNIRILDFWNRGPRQVTSNKPINSVADIKGMKIRLPEIPAMVQVWKAMGAAPTTMAMNEVYTALQQNVIDGQENPVPNIYSAKLYEVQKYIAMTSHKYEYVTLSMSDKTWAKLSPDQQKVITDASKVAADFYNSSVKDTTEKNLAEIKQKGVQVTTPNIEEFKAAAKPAQEAFAKTVNADLYQQILKDIQ